MYECVCTPTCKHIWKWRGHGKVQGISIEDTQDIDHTLRSSQEPDRQCNRCSSWVKANRNNRGYKKEEKKKTMHQKAFKFNFRKTNRARQIKHNYIWIQESGQIQLPVFKADNATGPTNHFLIPSEGGPRGHQRLQGTHPRTSHP